MDNICFHFLSVLLIQCFLVGFTMTAVTNLISDQSTLLELKDHIIDPHNVLATNWSTISSACHWVGVSCSARHGRVSDLDLSHMDLKGTILPNLGNLSFLVSLNLSGNYFHGNLPKELARLRRLKLIDLSYNAFNGEIPLSFGALHKVQYLVLNNNNFTGTIPPTLANMSNLEALDLGHNLIQGNIPYEIGDLQNLKTFHAHYNQLLGPIPSSIFNISSLQSISLAYNTLSGNLSHDMCYHLPELENFIITENEISGYIPSSIGECSKLQLFTLDYNRFGGIIPRSIGNLTRLKQLFLGKNSLEGEIPSGIGNLLVLETFSAGDMRLHGSIPASIFNLSSLQKIYLNNNSVSGKLPCMSLVSNLEVLVLWGNYLSGNILDCISHASKLRILDLDRNSFSGHIPNTLGNLSLLEELRLWSNNLTTKTPNHEWSFLSSLANCKHLRLLEISYNPLNGILPTSISNLSPSLEKFTAYDCKIKGSIPMEIGSLSKIILLGLAQNELIGSIPATLGRAKNLQVLQLFNNILQGSIPYNVCRLERLYQLELSGNMLQGPLPKCLGDLTSLRYLYFNSNKIDSTIPFTFWSLKDILIADLSSNYLNGSLPLDIGNLKVLIYLNLSRNLLSSDIPVTIGGLNGLQSLSLSSNRLQGPIPQSMGELTSLESLDLSNNNLSGIIPKSLDRLSSLRFFNVASNRLEGEIPTEGCFRSFTIESFMNNFALCGSPKLQVPPCRNNTHLLSKKMTPMHVLRYVLPIIASMVVILTFIIVLKKCQSRSTNLSINEGLSLEIQSKNLYNRLLHATNRFSEDNLLGSGGFGSVFKGTLSNAKDVAVKVFNLQSEGAFRSFDVECEVMQNILHRNLVKVISCCSCIDFKALVLEFMPNGSLEKWLYSYRHSLDILQRINITMDVASALEYLHLGHPNPIIHCDLKPSNILLDRDMVAHVGDFGIAKLLGEAESVKQTMTLATLGYMAPEYGSTGIVSKKSDVFSYGILLMEAFTRTKPIDEIFTGEMSMKHWVEESLSNGMISVVDSKLLQKEEKHFLAKANCISSIMRLALDCAAELPEERKDMKDVVSILEKIKIKYLTDIRRA